MGTPIAVSRTLNDRGLATLLVDLLRWEEKRDRTNVFDIRLRCERLIAATRWAVWPATGSSATCSRRRAVLRLVIDELRARPRAAGPSAADARRA